MGEFAAKHIIPAPGRLRQKLAQAANSTVDAGLHAVRTSTQTTFSAGLYHITNRVSNLRRLFDAMSQPDSLTYSVSYHTKRP